MRKVLLAVAVAVVAAAVPATAQPLIPNTVVADDAPSGAFELVGHSPLNNRGMNAALAVHGDYAYVGSRTDAKLQNANGAGVLVVDVSKPDAPEVVKEIGPPNEANPGETSREMRIWHSQELLLVMNLYSNCGEIHACTPTEANDNFRFYDISGKNGADPKLVAEYEPSVDPHEFFLWEDPKNPKRALLFMSTPGGGATQMLVTDISNYKKKKFAEIGKYSVPVDTTVGDPRLHSLSVSPDGKTGYIAHLESGFLVLDTSEIAKGVKKPNVKPLTAPEDAPKWPDAPGPGIHSAIPFFGRDFVMTTDEVYGEALKALNAGGCPWGWAKFIDVRNPAKPKVISEFKLPQNEESYCALPETHQYAPRSQHPMSSFAAHNPTLTKNLAVLTWHAGGLQAINISNPAKPTQAAEFKPDPLPYVLQEDPVLSSGQDKVVMWSFPIIKDGLVYVVDVRNGLYILKYTGPFANEISSVDFLEGNSNQGAALKLAR